MRPVPPAPLAPPAPPAPLAPTAPTRCAAPARRTSSARRTTRTRRTTPAALAALVLAGLAPAACTPGGTENGEAAEPPRQEAGSAAVESRVLPRPGRAWVIFGADTVVAELAATEEERAQGLMFRDDLPDGTGMLFVFPEQSVRSFWMQDTYVALDIAFIDTDFRIVDIQQMEPLSTDRHESPAPVMYALEVPLGWFAEHGVEVGDVAEIVLGG
jgi:hypothetical protein